MTGPPTGRVEVCFRRLCLRIVNPCSIRRTLKVVGSRRPLILGRVYVSYRVDVGRKLLSLV